MLARIITFIINVFHQEDDGFDYHLTKCESCARQSGEWQRYRKYFE